MSPDIPPPSQPGIPQPPRPVHPSPPGRAVVFYGAFGTGVAQWIPAQAILSDGNVSLYFGTPGGWQQQFIVPASEVVVKSAAQRITLKVRGISYPILADPQAATLGLGLQTMGLVGAVADLPGVQIGSGVAGLANQASTAAPFAASGGHEFLAAMQPYGRVSRLSFGGVWAIAGGAAIAVVVFMLVFVVVLAQVL